MRIEERDDWPGRMDDMQRIPPNEWADDHRLALFREARRALDGDAIMPLAQAETEKLRDEWHRALEERDEARAERDTWQQEATNQADRVSAEVVFRLSVQDEVAALEAENTRLAKLYADTAFASASQQEEAEDLLQDALASFEAANAGRSALTERLYKKNQWLWHYGRHKKDCTGAAGVRVPCSCGLDDARCAR